MKQPDNQLYPAFEDARDWIAFQENQLTKTQKEFYNIFEKSQDKDKQKQQEKAERAKADYNAANQKKPGAVKNYDPPFKVNDPHVRQKAFNAQAEYKKLDSLKEQQQQAKVSFLEKLAEQRERIAKQQDQKQEKQKGQEKGDQFRDNAKAMTQNKATPAFSQAAAKKEEAALQKAWDKVEHQQAQREHDKEHGMDHSRNKPTR